MTARRRIAGGLIGVIGFMLSPLSWWNDLFVNVPLAVAFAWLVSLLWRPAFAAALVVGYWLTNLVGLLLLHKGVRQALVDEPPRAYSRRALLRDLGVSLLYTAVIIVLVELKLLRPVAEYFQAAPPR
jgi:hypothetical protein